MCFLAIVQNPDFMTRIVKSWLNLSKISHFIKLRIWEWNSSFLKGELVVTIALLWLLRKRNPINFWTQFCCPRIPYKVVLTLPIFINSEKSHVWRWVIILRNPVLHPGFSGLSWIRWQFIILANMNDVRKNWMQWKLEDRCWYQLSTLYNFLVPNCTQWNFNGLLYN